MKTPKLTYEKLIEEYCSEISINVKSVETPTVKQSGDRLDITFQVCLEDVPPWADK